MLHQKIQGQERKPHIDDPLASRVPLPHQASTQAAQIAGFRALGFWIWGFTGLGLVGFIGFGV